MVEQCYERERAPSFCYEVDERLPYNVYCAQPVSSIDLPVCYLMSHGSWLRWFYLINEHNESIMS